MKRKTRSANKKAPNDFQTKIKTSFKKFRKIVESKLGRVNWEKVGTIAVAILLVVATKGLLGPEAQVVATQVVKWAAYA